MPWPLFLAAAASLPPALAGVPGVSVVTYPVRGDDVPGIQASLGEAGPVDPNDGSHVAAITHWKFDWRWPGTPGGDDCDLSAASVRFSAEVTLPRLVGIAQLGPALQAAWRRYRGAIEAHEANHVRYAYAQRAAVLAAIRGATCATAEAAGQAVLAGIAAHDLAYDRETSHGEREGASFP